MSSTSRPTRIGTAAGALLLTATLVGGCTDEQGAAQEADALPTDREVVAERADQARVKGAEDAPVRVVEVSDFQCPYCAQFFTETFPTLDSLYVQTGKVTYVWISFPNPSHPRAWPSIEAAFCAGAVGKFWPMHDLLFQRQQEWSQSEDPFADFVGYAEELGIESSSFTDCMRNDEVAPLMVRDYQNVVRSGINSTPFFIVADSVAIRGAAPADSFRTVIDAILSRRGAEPAAGGGAQESESPEAGSPGTESAEEGGGEEASGGPAGG